MSRQKPRGNIAFYSIILLLVLVMIFSGLQIMESTVFNQQTPEDNYLSKTVIRDGIAYYPRQDITVIMVLGIDQFGPVTESGSYNNSGVADVISLLIFNETDHSARILQLNRDTMTDIPVLGIGGKYAGTKFGQIALAHTYGTGLADSCENTRKAVSDFLNGIRIDYYLSMNMDAIRIMTDTVGGVKVNVTDDFSLVDPSIQMGEMTLNGEQAIHFVRTRKDVADQMNISRMQRHREYVNGLTEALRANLDADETFAVTAYNNIADYVIADCSVNAITGMMNRYADYRLVEIVSPEGENTKGEKYMEFYADQDKLDELILRLFYAPKQ